MQRIDNILTQTLIILRKMNYTIFRLRGKPFDPEGGGLANLVWTDYLFSSIAQSENVNKQKKMHMELFSSFENLCLKLDLCDKTTYK